jgi:peroxiredoxin Q/BCP
MIVQRLQSLMVLGLILAGALAGPSRATALEVGEQAPDFTLPSTTGQETSLSQFRGKQPVLLEFYGQDFAPV